MGQNSNKSFHFNLYILKTRNVQKKDDYSSKNKYRKLGKLLLKYAYKYQLFIKKHIIIEKQRKILITLFLRKYVF